MVVMYSFCKYFSVRLGSIIVAVITMFQSFVGIILFSLWLKSPDETSHQISSWLNSNDFIFATGLFREFENYTTEYLQVGLAFISVHFSSCILLILGAYKLNITMIVPYLILELVRLLILSATHVVAMMIIKRNILDIGLVILWTLAGGFTLLQLYYMWFCVVSLCQCIREVRRPTTTESNQNIFIDEFSTRLNARNGFGNDLLYRNNYVNNSIRNLPTVNLNNINSYQFSRPNNNLMYGNEFQFGNLIRPGF